MAFRVSDDHGTWSGGQVHGQVIRIHGQVVRVHGQVVKVHG